MYPNALCLVKPACGPRVVNAATLSPYCPCSR